MYWLVMIRNSQAAQVGALFEPLVAAVRTQICLLYQVFCVGTVPGHAQRRAVQLWGVLHRLLRELGPICHVATLAGVSSFQTSPSMVGRFIPNRPGVTR